MITTERKVLNSISQTLKQNIGGDIHHYTNINGLQGIIQTNHLWASHAFYLNDMSEISHSFEIIREALNSKYHSNQNELLELANSEWNSVHKPNIFITSFSNISDSLSQWRAYGKHGESYSISFNKIFLSSCLIDIGELLDVIYDNNAQINIINTLIDNYLSEITIEKKQILLDNQCRILFNLLSLFLPLFKNSSFSEENEVRLVVREDSLKPNNIDINYRAGNGILIPYIEIDYFKNIKGIDEFPISSIMVGPNKYSGIAEDSLFHFSKKYLIKEIPIHRTRIPYRL